MDNIDVALRKAGLMSAHVALFSHMNDLRQMLFLAEVLDERGASAALVRVGSITVIAGETAEEPTFTTAKNRSADAPTCYRTLQSLKGHDAEVYAVTTPELKALNAGAVERLKASDDLAAFAATLAKLDAAPAGRAEAARADAVQTDAAKTDAKSADTAPELPRRGRSEPEAREQTAPR